MLSYNLPNYLAMDTAIFQAINTLVLAIKVIVCSPVNSAMEQKAMIAKNSALAQKQPFPFSIIPQTVVKCQEEDVNMRMNMNYMVIVEEEKTHYSITINATPMSCQKQYSITINAKSQKIWNTPVLIDWTSGTIYSLHKTDFF